MRMQKVVCSVLMSPKAFSTGGTKKLRRAGGHAIREAKLGRQVGARSRRVLFVK